MGVGVVLVGPSLQIVDETEEVQIHVEAQLVVLCRVHVSATVRHPMILATGQGE